MSKDNELFATRIEIQLLELDYDIVGVTGNSEDALDLILSKMPDLIIMDVNIQGKLDGVSLAEKIKKLEIPILFITTSKDKTFYERAKQTPYIGYLIKPFDQITLQSAIEFGLNTLRKKEEEKEKEVNSSGWKEDFIHNDHLLIKHGNKLRKLSVNNILVFTSDGNYCIVHTAKEKFIVNTSLTKIIHFLPQAAFIRIHKKHIIQLEKIENIFVNDSYLEIGRQKLSIGRTFKKDLMKRFDILN